MASDMFNEGYAPTAERADAPSPEICPCVGIRNFKCPAKNQNKLIPGRCKGSQNYTRCPNFSSWYWFKCAQEKAKAMSPPDGYEEQGDFSEW